jgi:hypothetical protein
MSKYTIYKCLDYDKERGIIDSETGEPSKTIMQEGEGPEEAEDFVKSADYSGKVIALSNVDDPNLLIFFPISDSNAKLINKFIKHDYSKDDSIDLSNFSIYSAMSDSWKSSERYLSGIIMDSVIDEDSGEDVIQVKLMLSDVNGYLHSLISVGFFGALMLSILENVEIFLTEELLAMILPSSSYSDEGFEDYSDRESSYDPYNYEGSCEFIEEDDDDDDDDDDEDDEEDAIYKKTVQSPSENRASKTSKSNSSPKRRNITGPDEISSDEIETRMLEIVKDMMNVSYDEGDSSKD